MRHLHPPAPRLASADDATVRRDGPDAIITHHDARVPPVRLRIGPAIAQLSDQELLDRHNDTLLYSAPRPIALEIPPGRPQLEWFEPSLRWAPRGQVLRCVIDDGEAGEPLICIDDHELTLGELGQLLAAQSGLGVRIVFVPVDALDLPPRVLLGEP